MPLKTRTALSDDPDSSTSTLGNMLELPGTSSSSTSQELPFVSSFCVSVNLCGSYQRDVIIGSKILEPLEKNVMHLK
ncbi:hypothetical protein FD754_010021 [Muntiacus muntjak]|uniref:Uncharacterized protein n=1 Tax=Muntiacus muntjak TaxID=9888 RepID=A0A5N3WYJ6_MUNMU|nr:hypothetical protein FD754_010021 [Muntiacus muntjak]